MKSVASNEIAEYVTPVEASVIYKKRENKDINPRCTVKKLILTHGFPEISGMIIVLADHGSPKNNRISKIFELIALFITILAFPFIVIITDDTASGIDVHAPRNIIPIILSKS